MTPQQQRDALPTRPGFPRCAATLAAVAIWPLGVLAVVGVAGLPGRLAVSWDGRGPDTFASTSSVTAVAVAAGTVALLVVALALVAPGRLTWGVGSPWGSQSRSRGGAAGLWGLLAVTALTAPDPRDPPAPTVAMLVPLVTVLVARALGGSAYGHPPVDPLPRPRLGACLAASSRRDRHRTGRTKASAASSSRASWRSW